MIRFRALIALAVTLIALAVGASAASAALVGFQSPSENIGCTLFRVQGIWFARCDIAQHTWPTPRRPANCKLDYGNGVQLASHGRARYTCAGDTTLGSGAVLGYGHSITRGPIRCTSRATGVTCLNTHHHHGFVISRSSVRMY